MDTITGLFTSLFDVINTVTWGWALIPMLVVFGVFFTLASGFVQIAYFGRMFRVLMPGQSVAEGQVSPLQALLVSVGGRVGGGNIAGVAVAITLGGPGAVFWMWVIAIIGMATSFFECTLAQAFKRNDPSGTYRGGPAQYIIHGLPEYRWMAYIYAVALIMAFGLGFNAFQGNTVAGSMLDTFGLSRLISGIGLAAIAGIVVFGGIRRIAQVSEVVVPFMAFGYLGMALLIIVINIGDVPGMFLMIFKNAFGFEEAVGGGIGAAVAQGMRRGLFSNEAGLGSAPNVAAIAHVRHPVNQGIVQALSVFIDTIIICTCTASVILLSGIYEPGASIDGVALTQGALADHMGGWTRYFLSGAILLFAFSSIIYNYYLGENALAVLAPGNSSAIMVFRVLVIALVFLGASAEGATAVFAFSDPAMGILALINLMALMMLFPTGLRVLNDYRRKQKAGEERPLFKPEEFPDLDLDKEAWANADK